MVFRQFRVQCIARILILTAFIFLFIYLAGRDSHRATSVVLGLVIFYQVYALIHYVDRTNRDLTRFLLSIKHADFSQSFLGTGLGASLGELKKAFNDVLDSFRAIRAEKEEHFRYLNTVVQHIGIGLIAFRSDGEVELINTAAKRILGINTLKNVHSLESVSKDLVRALLELAPRQQALVQVDHHNEQLQLAIHATAFLLHEQEFTLVSLQNIQAELEEREIEAWENLIRVLTHEIMNSVTPIASLAGTANALLQESGKETEKPDSDRDVREAVDTIQRRSEGLLQFVQQYRKLTRLPAPNFQLVSVSKLFSSVENLMRAQLDEGNVRFCLNVEPDTLEISADPQQIEQVLINLLRNAIQAVDSTEDPKILLKAKIESRGRVAIEVVDNGAGIVEEALDKIFIPFFTTKQDGSGIGLSLSRQIMHLHRGSISARSRPGEETVFTLRF